MIDFKTLLCPVDFSDASRHALDHAIAIAGWYESHITAVHVVAPSFAFEPPILFAERGNLDAVPADRDDLQRRLNGWLDAATAAHVPWAAKVCDGPPADQVISEARSLGADLIVMGSHGRSGFERLIVGSVAEKVLRNAACPVLTVPPSAATKAVLPFRQILCPVDFSDSSLTALQVALSMAEEADARLVLMHVVDWADEERLVMQVVNSPDLRDQLERQVRDRLEGFIPDESRVFSRPETKVAIGKAHREIVSVAEEMAADLIVIGVHGRNELALAVFGSTTNQVVRRAPCPVLTIRTKS